MNYEQVKKLNPADFKRYFGVHQETFKEMVKIVSSEKILQKKSGRPSKLCREDQILMTLSYLRQGKSISIRLDTRTQKNLM